jgi:hypothetical protein
MTNLDINYMKRSRDYYRAQGYATDYEWAHFEDVPFTRPIKPLSESRIAIVTTAMPNGQIPKKLRTVSSAPVQPPPDSMHTADLSWDKINTHTRDVPSFLPIEQIGLLKAEGVIGELADNFYSVPTDYSKRNTQETDAPEILELCRHDQVDIALLVPL